MAVARQPATHSVTSSELLPKRAVLSVCPSPGATWAAIEYPQADVRCITFGSPRVGNNKFKRAFHTLVGTSLRLVYGADPVTMMPPAFR